MKKLYKSLIALILILSMLMCIGSVLAIDETLNDLPTSEAGDIWQDEIKPILVVMCASGSGSILGLLGFLINAWKNRRASNEQKDKETAFINNLCTKLGLTSDQINLVKGNYEMILSKVDETINNKVIPLTDEIKRLTDLCLKALDESQSLKDFITKTIQQTNINDDKIMKVLQIAFINHPALVMDSSATAIKRVLNDGN
jgi:hypothetical protein